MSRVQSIQKAKKEDYHRLFNHDSERSSEAITFEIRCEDLSQLPESMSWQQRFETPRSEEGYRQDEKNAQSLEEVSSLFARRIKVMQAARESFLEVFLQKDFAVQRALIEGQTVAFANVGEKFNALAEAWENYNAGRSILDYHQISYMQIIGMGLTVVPLLMKSMQSGQSKWVYALKCITGEQADTSEMLGDRLRVVDAWLKWGKRNDYL